MVIFAVVTWEVVAETIPIDAVPVILAAVAAIPVWSMNTLWTPTLFSIFPLTAILLNVPTPVTLTP